MKNNLLKLLQAEGEIIEALRIQNSMLLDLKNYMIKRDELITELLKKINPIIWEK